MDHQRFDAISQLAAHGPDRRNMLKLAGAAAVAGTAGFLAHAEDAEAAVVTVTITNFTGPSTDVAARGTTTRRARNVAAQICAAVKKMNSLSGTGGSVFGFTCTYPGQ